MSTSLGERLLIPILLTAIVAALSGAYTFFVGGGTRLVKTIGLSAMVFTAGVLYCMAWHEQLAALFGWQDAWIGASIIVAIGSIVLCKVLLARKPTHWF